MNQGNSFQDFLRKVEIPMFGFAIVNPMGPTFMGFAIGKKNSKTANLMFFTLNPFSQTAEEVSTYDFDPQTVDVETMLEDFDITSDIRSLLLGKDDRASCVWRACDPFHTEAVRGLEGDGKESKCGRVNKEGIDYLRPDKKGYERYIHLYKTEDKDGGCKSCRFFLMCKGQCPGTGIDGDWRKKSEQIS